MTTEIAYSRALETQNFVLDRRMRIASYQRQLNLYPLQVQHRVSANKSGDLP